eukprot:TRINITY_DN18988_c0_g1_i1.p1 TRINITY_DN18988_c0_g1~~TRINITY_DN18988_c0_g1_i1.p1  ORF type:complete len:932 (+),score=258.10 TRINITY_DN18988_c0_g1_i1:75-2870(+)
MHEQGGMHPPDPDEVPAGSEEFTPAADRDNGRRESASVLRPMHVSTRVNKAASSLVRDHVPQAAGSRYNVPLATGATTQPPGTWESIDFEEAEEDHEFIDAQREPSTACWRLASEWFLIALVGVGVGVIAWLQALAVGGVTTWKLHTVQHLLSDSGYAAAYFYSLGVWIGLALVAAGLTLWAPQAAGSGIPQVKAYLNGVRIPGLFRMRTFVAKVVGITACLGIGFPAGREGPMVQVGGILASGLARGYTSLCSGCQLQLHMSDTRFEHRRRDFVAMGTAAGVAGAFNAPIGGVLFAIEEVSSFWAGSLTFRSFVCAIIAAYVVTVLLQGSDIEDEGWVLFGPNRGKDRINFHAYEIAPFALLGAVGGLVGALYNGINTLCMKVRGQVFKGRKPIRIVEAVVHICVIMTIFFFIPCGFSCEPLPPFAAKFDHGLHFIQHDCDEGSFSPMATLMWNPPERLLLQLYSRQTPTYFAIPELAVFAVVYTLLASVTFGIAVPSGLFIPSMIIGASVGRLAGVVMHSWSSDLDPGVYALVGAAACLGGITRMTVSLAAILVETTNDPNLILPIMLSLAVSKAVAEQFNESIYDIVLERTGVLHLSSSAPLYKGARARDVMTANPLVLGHKALAADLRRATATRHHAFPIVGRNNVFFGIISRQRLMDALEYHTGRREPSRVPQDTEIELLEHMDPTPFVVLDTLSLNRTYRLFRSMGMRHLCVIDRGHRLVGIITRVDFCRLERGKQKEHGGGGRSRTPTPQSGLDGQVTPPHPANGAAPRCGTAAPGAPAFARIDSRRPSHQSLPEIMSWVHREGEPAVGSNERPAPPLSLPPPKPPAQAAAQSRPPMVRKPIPAPPQGASSPRRGADSPGRSKRHSRPPEASPLSTPTQPTPGSQPAPAPDPPPAAAGENQSPNSPTASSSPGVSSATRSPARW